LFSTGHVAAAWQRFTCAIRHAPVAVTRGRPMHSRVPWMDFCSVGPYCECHVTMKKKTLFSTTFVQQGCHIGEFIARFRNLVIFWKHLAPNFFVWRNVRPVHLHVFAYIFICRFTIFKLADDLKIHDIKWKCESFQSRKHGIEHFLSNMFAQCWNCLCRNIWKISKTYSLSGKIQGER